MFLPPRTRRSWALRLSTLRLCRSSYRIGDTVAYANRHSQAGQPVTKDTRASMVRSAATLIRTRGVSATSFSDVLADSGAPRGSVYHHFPEGKEQLAGDAIRWTSDRVLAHHRAGT